MSEIDGPEADALQSAAEIDVNGLDRDRLYSLLTSLVVPRPIAWVSSLDADGVRNLAPHSYFNVISSDPVIVHFTSSRRRGNLKDSANNVEQTGEFVINLVSRAILERMNMTSLELEPSEDEFAWAGVDAIPSKTVAPPRVAGAPASLECRLIHTLRLGNGTMLFGEVKWIHIAPGIFDGKRVDIVALDPVARLGGPWYAALGERILLPRPTMPGSTHVPSDSAMTRR
jgi:flavin reductase (DIM6/NTAB) family NADH-FMN oxidoreductase RutF